MSGTTGALDLSVLSFTFTYKPTAAPNPTDRSADDPIYKPTNDPMHTRIHADNTTLSSKTADATSPTRKTADGPASSC